MFEKGDKVVIKDSDFYGEEGTVVTFKKKYVWSKISCHSIEI
jgi:ribosomal protein L24